MIRTQQRTWTQSAKWSEPVGELPDNPQLVFVFGDRELVAQPELFQQIQQFYPEANILMGSTAGNILDETVTTNTVTVSALHFEKTRISFSETTIENKFDSKNVGKKLAEFLPTEGLVHSIVLSDGLSVNGSALVRSINKHLPESVTVTGGLVGDGVKFEKTLVHCNGVPQSNNVALIGFYGDSLHVGYASKGGWKTSDNAEHEFVITKSKENVLYELNGRPALDVYKEFLGDEAADLPNSATPHPLQLILPEEGEVVRAVLAINEEDGSMNYAGDMPEGITARLMHATENELIASAKEAGTESIAALEGYEAQFALLVSCLGRKAVLGDRTHEEITAVRQAIGPKAAIHGFYSYGELCPETGKRQCLLHNQTMTITTFAED